MTLSLISGPNDKKRSLCNFLGRCYRDFSIIDWGGLSFQVAASWGSLFERHLPFMPTAHQNILNCTFCERVFACEGVRFRVGLKSCFRVFVFDTPCEVKRRPWPNT